MYEGLEGMESYPVAFSEFSGQRSSDVQAERLTEQRSIITPNGPVTGEEGDWEVREPGGNVRKLTDDEFQSEYGGEASGDKETTKSVYDERETGSYGPSDTETSVEEDAPKADSGTPPESDENDSQSEDTGEDAEREEETPASPRRPPRRR